jgi:GNAT superfamily N-acetyltransferase
VTIYKVSGWFGKRSFIAREQSFMFLFCYTYYCLHLFTLKNKIMITKKRNGTLLSLIYYGSVCSTRELGTLQGHFLSSRLFHLTHLFVHEEWRNHGIATALLNRLVYELRKNKIKAVTLDDCSDTGRCYLKFGFSYIEQGYPEMLLLL